MAERRRNNNMSQRKTLSKKTRFEVFKRDSFTCQYCGRSSPDVVLEVDHIVPVAEGGENDMMNLVTSCFDCNRGKGKRELSDESVVVKQKEQLDKLNERREQLKMMIEWRDGLQTMQDKMIDNIQDIFSSYTGFTFFEAGRRKIRSLIQRFGYCEVAESTTISICKYYIDDDAKSVQYALDKVGGVCYNRLKNKAEGDEK